MKNISLIFAGNQLLKLGIINNSLKLKHTEIKF